MRLVCASVLMLALVAPADAAPRAKTRFDGIRDCERLGSAQFKRRDPKFRRFAIDRSKVEVDRYADKVGSEFVSSIYRGFATYDIGQGSRPTQFICLHGGVGRDALFVYTMPQ